MSLLAQFFNKIKSSQEDIASEGLKYILQNSEIAKGIINSQISSLTGIQLPKLNYISQIVKKGLGRTDISGIDINGNEIIIFEAKFWASLTEKQPVSYLNRMSHDSVLVFICPNLRKNSLFLELNRKLTEQGIKFSSNDDLLKFDLPEKKFILIKSWEEILLPIKIGLKASEQDNFISDIDQIIGFCEVIDKNSFIPLNDKDLSPEIGRRISSFYELTDEVTLELSKNTSYKRGRLREGKPTKEFGYYKYRSLDGYGISFGLNFGYWAKFADTPFWLIISELDFNQSYELKFKLKNLHSKIPNTPFENNLGEILFPIYPIKYEDKDQVAKDMALQIENIIKELKTIK